MDLPDPKKLKKLADYCRKAGIKVYECEGMKITLADHYIPEPSAYMRKKIKGGKKASIQQESIPVSMPSAEELLFFSAGGPPDGFDPEDLPQ